MDIENAEIYAYLLQHAIAVKSELNLYQLSEILMAFSCVKEVRKNLRYLTVFVDDLIIKLKDQIYEPTIYGNLWDAILNFGCTKKTKEIREVVKLLALIYSDNKKHIDYEILIRVLFSATRVECSNNAFWSIF